MANILQTTQKDMQKDNFKTIQFGALLKIQQWNLTTFEKQNIYDWNDKMAEVKHLSMCVKNYK